MKYLHLYICVLGFVGLSCTAKRTTTEPNGSEVVQSSIAKPEPVASAPTTKTVAPNTDWITKDYLMGKFQPSGNAAFQLAPASITDGAQQYYLRTEVLAAFQAMRDEAAKSGITLKIISATRPFERQKQIWEAKWNGTTAVAGQNLSKTISDPVKRALKILTYSSMPGTSRHHWGTDMDLNSLEPAYFKAGQGKKVYQWLTTHAADFGFCQPYTAGRPSGYNEEQWHWSYMPTARSLTEKYPQMIKNQDISGFKGSETAVSIDMVNKYVLGINQTCK